MLRLLLALVIASAAFMLSDIVALLVSENCVEVTGLTRDTLYGTSFLALMCFPMFVSARLAGCEFSIPFVMELAVVGYISAVVTSMFDDYWGIPNDHGHRPGLRLDPKFDVQLLQRRTQVVKGGWQ